MSQASDRPNFVFMIADDCTYLDMEVYGGQAKCTRIVPVLVIAIRESCGDSLGVMW